MNTTPGTADSMAKERRELDPFHTLDHFGNEFVIEHGNVVTDGPTPVVLWPLALWRTELEQRRGSIIASRTPDPS